MDITGSTIRRKRLLEPPEKRAVIQEIFREIYLDLLEQQKVEFIRELLEDRQACTDKELANYLGYKGASGINQMKKGKISLQKFDMLLGKYDPHQTRWPTAGERSAQTLMRTMEYLANQELRTPLCISREQLECLAELWTSDQLHELLAGALANNLASFDSLATDILNKVHERVKTRQVNTPRDLQETARVWGKCYTQCKGALT